MKDIVVILMTLGFFALCVLYVALCDRIVGPDEQDGGDEPVSGGATAVGTADPADGTTLEVTR